MTDVNQNSETSSPSENGASNNNCYQAPNEPLYVSSGVKMFNGNVIWTIENFNFVQSQSKKLIGKEKMVFTAGNEIGLGTEWTACLKVEDIKDEGSKKGIPWIGICLGISKLPPGVKEVMGQVDLKVRKDQQNFFYEKSSGIYMFGGKSSWNFRKIIKKDENLDQMPLVNGSLVVELEITMSGRKPVKYGK